MSGTVDRPAGTNLRIAAWNCHQGNVDRKLPRLLDAFAPDVVVVPESEPTPQAASPTLLAPGVPHMWVGDPDHPRYGLGVFAPSAADLQLERSSDGEPSGLWLAVALDAPVASTIVGVVTRPHPAGPQEWPTEYIATTAAMLDHLDDVLRAGPSIIAGDFNFSGQSSGPRVAGILSRFRDDYGLRSAYHAFFDVEPGQEEHSTLSWTWNQDKRYHCDLVFVPKDAEILGVHVGAYEDWTANTNTVRSDHVPVVVDLRIP